MAAKLQPSLTYLPPFLLLLLVLINSSTALQEFDTLLQIKQSWGNPPTLSSWTPTTPHCNWTGITCTSSSSSATDISLPSLNLPGPFPAAICSLPNLTALDLFNNSISGPFPTSLYACSSLQYLDLSQNLLTGPLPSDIHHLPSNLTHLILSANNFSGDIPPSIGSLPAIQVLYLDYNLFNGTIPAELGNLSSTLQELWLANNPFPPTKIPPELGKLANLNYLWMTNTNLVGEIPETLAGLTEMQQLDLSENNLDGSIPSLVWSLSKLELLFLYKNKFTGEINTTSAIGAMALQRIDVSINRLTGAIPETFGQLQNLSVLLMYFNQLTGEIPASIGLLPSLTDLRLFNNSLSGPVPPELGRHSLLWNLEVDDNRLSGELPQGLCHRGAFASLVVFDNNLTGTIPASLGSCPSLSNIQVFNNRLSGEVPEGLWSATSLSTVIMHGNSLSGELPDVLPWNLTRLEIGGNRFSGAVPSSAGSLVVFDAGDNQFSGEIPPDMATKMPRLQILSIGGNTISGEIPPDISLLKSLTDLNLSSNQLAGHIPSTIGLLPVLTSLDLSDNHLSGLIPPEMGSLKLNFLNVSSNHLSGEIPSPLVNAAYDQSFFLNPGLCASTNTFNIPSCKYPSGNSGGLSPALRYMFLAIGALLLLIAAGFAFLAARDYRRGGGDLAGWKLTTFQSLDFNETAILRGLTEENHIGSGGAGKVYRVSVGSRGAVAVKKIWSSRKLEAKLEREFLSEVKILGSLRHTNIIKLLCCISGPESKLLVYEHMENGSLDRWLHGKMRRAAGGVTRVLNWPTSLRIAIGAAQGLCYMHHSSNPPIIHRDVKSSNILLDSEFRAKVADFGLARMLVKAGEPDTVSAVAGSIGYMAPECAYRTKVNEKVDVYSFGVVLLELITGREASKGGEHGSLVDWAWRHVQDGKKLTDMVDEEMELHMTPYIMDDIAVALRLAIICTGTLPSTRPTMKEVLQVLLRLDRWESGSWEKTPVEYDAAPLLHTKKPSDAKEEDDSGGLARNV